MRWKRFLDLALLTPLVPFFAAATGLLALVVLVAQGRPVFFVQRRVGRQRRTFRVFKLRTMTCEPQESARRPTRLGGWLRHRGLDELPQLFNVLLGDMSLVGPRPLSPADADRLCAKHPPFAARFALKPGLTGLAQVCQAQGVEATAALEADYAARASPAVDLGVLVRTAWINLVGKAKGKQAPPPRWRSPRARWLA